MALCNFKFNKTRHRSPDQLLSLVVMVMIAFFFPKVPLATSLNFNFLSFNQNDDTINRTYTYVDPNGDIHLTKNETASSKYFSVGRISYAQPLHLWDEASNKLIEFYTNFSFTIDSLNKPPGQYGDGMAFFLAPINFPVRNVSGGGFGLSNALRSLDPFVAVEFDTYQNEWDALNYIDHVGIDNSSLESYIAVEWYSGVKEGRRNFASVSYDSASTNLTVTFTNFNGNDKFEKYLSYPVDLRKILPEWVAIGFSAATGSLYEAHILHSWFFTSNLKFVNKSLPSIANGPSPTTKISPKPDVGGGGGGGEGGKKNTHLIVGCVIGGLLVVGGFMSIPLLYLRKCKNKKLDDDAATDDSMELEFEQGTGPKRYSYRELVQATNNFSEEGKLGEGGFGGVYRGYLSNLSVAVKRVSKKSKQGIKEYMSEVKIISRLRHKNFVQLVGWCHEKGELLLIYEFMPNGSLASHLFREDNMLSWSVRYNICLGLASALLYLHEESEQSVVHRDIKSSNVMLDSNFNTKLGDFGLARLMENTEIGLKTTDLAGTFGYMAPEYISTGKASRGSDVFSFGVVALEIACGRRSMELKNEEAQISLVSWAWDSYGNGRILDVGDRRFSTDFNVAEMECLLIVGLWCAHPDYSHRPSIRQALQVLKFEAALPNLPAKMPIPKYDVPSSYSSAEPLLSTSILAIGR